MLPETKDKLIVGLIMFFTVGILVAVIVLAFYGGNSDDKNEKRKYLSYIIGITTPIIALMTGLIYIYFSANPAYTNAYLIIANSISILISLCAVSIATLAV